MANQAHIIQVKGRDGLLGWIDPAEQSGDGEELLIRLANGQAILTPADLLVRQEDGSYYLPMSNEQFHRGDDLAPKDDDGTQETLMVIPVIVEKAAVGKRITSRKVRVSKKVNERQEVIPTPGYQEEVAVERIPVNKEVKNAPEVRREGMTTIIPLVEEVLVVEKRLILREEVHITLKRIPNAPQTVSLRSEHIDVERVDDNTDPGLSR